MPAKLERLRKGVTFTVALQAQFGGMTDKLIFISSKRYQHRAPETGTIIEELGPELPETKKFWIFRESDNTLHQLIDGKCSGVTTTFSSGQYRCGENILFG